MTSIGTRPSCSSWVTAHGANPRSACQPTRAGLGREHGSRLGQQSPTGGIEVVVVLVVAEQDGVDRANLRGRNGRPGQLPRDRTPAEVVPPPRRVKRGI